jgi:hypothetical protein
MVLASERVGHPVVAEVDPGQPTWSVRPGFGRKGWSGRIPAARI